MKTQEVCEIWDGGRYCRVGCMYKYLIIYIYVKYMTSNSYCQVVGYKWKFELSCYLATCFTLVEVSTDSNSSYLIVIQVKFLYMYLKIEIQNQGYELMTLLRSPVMGMTRSLSVSGRFGPKYL